MRLVDRFDLLGDGLVEGDVDVAVRALRGARAGDELVEWVPGMGVLLSLGSPPGTGAQAAGGRPQRRMRPPAGLIR
jgi:hypothetical protein